MDPLATHAGLRRLISAAVAAPSVHNTQPWRFRRREDRAIELHVDIDRLLRVIDPRGRAMYISCGAALFNLRLAIRAVGYEPLIDLLPDSGDQPTLLATVGARQSHLPSAAERELYAAIPHRRTSRSPFADRPVPKEVLGQLVNAARSEGAILSPLDPQTAARMLSLVAAADDELMADPAYRAELAHWTLNGNRSDGVPWYTFGPRPSRRGVRVRDFGLARRAAGRDVDDFIARPQLAVLSTGGDEPGDWLRAGQALQRVLLTATRYGLSTSPLTQPLDVREIRHYADVRGPLHGVQMIIRLGYGPPVPASPRRPVPEVLDRTA